LEVLIACVVLDLCAASSEDTDAADALDIEACLADKDEADA